ncbi:hypothetical protein B0H10DRAFT_2228633 [Mycena sp. CBHHK59/15]|nr:hypothetical protein B0H10DRAFT_2228633 [Mycena sp. CBHHK59/15]
MFFPGPRTPAPVPPEPGILRNPPLPCRHPVDPTCELPPARYLRPRLRRDATRLFAHAYHKHRFNRFFLTPPATLLPDADWPLNYASTDAKLTLLFRWIVARFPSRPRLSFAATLRIRPAPFPRVWRRKPPSACPLSCRRAAHALVTAALKLLPHLSAVVEPPYASHDPGQSLALDRKDIGGASCDKSRNPGAPSEVQRRIPALLRPRVPRARNLPELCGRTGDLTYAGAFTPRSSHLVAETDPPAAVHHAAIHAVNPARCYHFGSQSDLDPSASTFRCGFSVLFYHDVPSVARVSGAASYTLLRSTTSSVLHEYEAPEFQADSRRAPAAAPFNGTAPSLEAKAYLVQLYAFENRHLATLFTYRDRRLFLLKSRLRLVDFLMERSPVLD